jgi:hypothetical protein
MTNLLVDGIMEVLSKLAAAATGWRVEGCAVELAIDDDLEHGRRLFFRGAVTGVQGAALLVEARPSDGSGPIAQLGVSPRYRGQTPKRLRLASLVINVTQPYPGMLPSRGFMRAVRPGRADAAD